MVGQEGATGCSYDEACCKGGWSGHGFGHHQCVKLVAGTTPAQTCTAHAMRVKDKEACAELDASPLVRAEELTSSFAPHEVTLKSLNKP